MVMVPTRWLASASEEELAQYLGAEVVCPRCGRMLRRDPFWSRPYYVDDRNHTYSNMRVLLEELDQRG